MRRIRIGVIGLGRFGQFHCQKYKSLTDHKLVGVYDCNDLLSRQTSLNYNCNDFKSCNSLLKEVDAVSVVTPTVTHFEYVRRALLQGVHVFVEKPLASSPMEASELVALAEEKNLILQVGHIERFNGELLRLNPEIPQHVDATRACDNNGRCRDVCVVYDLMIHDLDIILSYFGKWTEVVAGGDINRVIANIKFNEGRTAKVVADRDSLFEERTMEFFYIDKEPIVVDFHRKKNDSLMEEVRNFIGSIINGSRPVVSGSDGLLAIELAEEIRKGISNV